MRIKVRSGLFLLFGVQGVIQVLYWELIKGYPACFMCKGYRVLYISILLTAILYRKRASFVRLLVLCGLIAVETLWGLWNVVQQMGVVTKKCNATAQIIEEKMVFVPCAAQFDYWDRVFSSPVGLNALLSVMMLGYVIGVLWQLQFWRFNLWRFKGFRWSLILISLLIQDIVASSQRSVNTAIQQAVNVQNNKAFEKDVQKIRETAEKNAKLYEAQARQLGDASSKSARAAAQAIIDGHHSSHANKGCCIGKCHSFQLTSEFEPSLQVCMSFSVPIQVWKDLNEDLIRHQGVFVVKGLPNNSFQAFAGKVLEFRKQGITAPIRIDPKLFDRHQITQVPVFVVNEKEESHTVSGTVTIPYVMNILHIKQEGNQ